MGYTIVTEQEVITREVSEVEVNLLGYIGHKVQEKRKQADINIAQLSRRLANSGHDLSPTTLSRIERGLCPLKVEDLAIIANYFEVKPGAFYPEGYLN